MENDRGFHGSKENLDSNNSRNNTEYIATRCRITKPAPPKPATNPMQFVKFSPSKLLSTAKEQIKKAEEVKVVSSKIRDDAEDWQANLDNWKSCRRKRVEHIIERVVEVKKFEQLDSERSRRKSKTFHEILEEKGKRRTKLSIPIYEDDDNNDLSDLGLGNNSNQVKSSDSERQVNENEMTRVLESAESTNAEAKDNNENQCQTVEVNSTYDKVESSCSSASETIAENQRTNESKTICENINNVHSKYTESNCYKIESNCKTSPTYHLENENKISDLTDVSKNNNGSCSGQEQQYTYESAIQGYRTRVKSNLNSNISGQFSRSEDHSSDDQETNMIVQKGSILKKKELFESDKVFEINSYESTSSKRVQNDFVNSQSLKERLKSLEKCGAATMTTTVPTPAVTANDLTQQISISDTQVKNRSSMLESIKCDLEKSRNKWRENSTTTTSASNCEWNGNEESERPASPETNMFVDKIEKFRNSLDKLGASCEVADNRQDDLAYDLTYNKQQTIDFESYNKEPIDFAFNKETASDYCPPNYLALSSPVEVDLLTSSSQYCDTDREDSGIHTADVSCSVSQADEPVEDTDLSNIKFEHMEMNDKYSECSLDATSAMSRSTVVWPLPVESRPSYPTVVMDYGFPVDAFPLGPPPVPLEPPKEKPPPPPKPTADDDLEIDDPATRIKKEIRMKRSSFLGISSDLSDNELASNIVPKVQAADVTSFIPLENALNRQQQLFRGAHGSFSEAGDSQDSGVEMDRAGNQVSTPDGWSSGISDFEQSQHNTPINKVYPETGIAYEEEIVQKEKEIIALVEKEEQWRVGSNKHQYRKRDLTKSFSAPKLDLLDHPISLFNECSRADFARDDDDHHFEMMQVKRELVQLEQEANLKRQKEAMRMNKTAEVMHSCNDRLSNKRLSLEDITNSGMNHPIQMHQGNPDYRKSMPELQYNNAMYMNTYNVCVDNANQVHNSFVRPIRPKLPEQYDSNRPTIMGHGQSADAPRLRPRSQGDLKNYNQHWLIQEAEQRRISNQMYQSSSGMRCDSWKLTKPDKHLPDSVIQTLTNRLQKKLLMPQPHQRIDNLAVYNPHHPVSGQLHHSQPMEESQDKMLSVSGKKKCSYCENELGRGAAMIIESLCLFYHMECFKCCVCHVQLGDGRMGTDVRVRNSKLHCHNCYSSDDGVKFSCV